MSAGNFLYCSLGNSCLLQNMNNRNVEIFLVYSKEKNVYIHKNEKYHFSIMRTIAKFIIYAIFLITGYLVMMTVLAIKFFMVKVKCIQSNIISCRHHYGQSEVLDTMKNVSSGVMMKWNLKSHDTEFFPNVQLNSDIMTIK